MRTLALALALAAAQPADPVYASGFEPAPAAATYIVEFTILQPQLVETVTCGGWSALADLTGASQYGVFSGVHCVATGAIPSRTGTQGGNVSAEFDLGAAGTLTLSDCRLQGMSGSGGAPDVVLTYNIDCN